MLRNGRALATLLSTLAVLAVSGEHSPAQAQTSVKPRFLIAFDTSGSMALDLSGTPTFGDGMGAGCGSSAGVDTNCDGLRNDSRMFVAKNAVQNMVLAFGDVDWALARFNQTTAAGVTCTGTSTIINNYECNTAGPFVTSYGDPACNTGATLPTGPGGGCPFDWASLIPAACRPGTGGRPAFRVWAAPGSPSVCLNYRGTCTGGDILVGYTGFGAFTTFDNTSAILKWVDGTEPMFDASTTSANFCNHATTGNCELRPEGATPLGGILTSALGYIGPIRTADTAASCRPYNVILLTDGVESCGGNPSMVAGMLLAAGVRVYVVGISISAAERGTLNAIATAGGTDAGDPGGDTAFFPTDPTALAAGLADIVRRSLLSETCNNLDDNCNMVVDEGFQKYCNRPAGITMSTLCANPGEICNGIDDNCFGGIDEGVTNACGTCGAVPGEVCDGLDNDCDGVIDEGGVCACVPSTEICDNLDNDCDGLRDEGPITRPCGTDVGLCSTGIQTCSMGVFGACTGTGPATEVCDGFDNDCDGVVDGNTRACGSATGACNPGTQVCTAGTFGTCIGAIGPSTELCDGIDNDCDGSTDEGNPGGGAACGSSIGACRPGTLSCTGGSLMCTGGVGPTAELCNSIDDNCNGLVDDGVATMGACGSSVGECRPGILACVAGAFTCTGARGPVAEICDGRDNDCDTMTDEGNPGGGVPCGSSVGECSPGTSVCTGGMLACMGGTGPGTEVCNNLDDDCDSLVDEGNPGGGGPCGMTDVGECDLGAFVCTMGMLVCSGATDPTPERCNGLDDDCDGMVDEGNPEGGLACGDDTGECVPGTTRCDMGMLLCEGATGPTPEVCNGLDDDCDGVADEGLPVGAACGSDIGECSPGVNVCRSSVLMCEGAIGPVPELCDALDNDCDTSVDEDLPSGAPCGTDEGLCMAGALHCDPATGREVCDGEIGPTTEVCDCDDNDCDGATDEPPPTGSLCPVVGGVASTCVDCQCALPCEVTEFGDTCPTGRFARRVGAECFCVMERCNPTTCATEEHGAGDTRCGPAASDPGVCVCRENRCTFACDGVTCTEGRVCDPDSGRCVEDSCRGLGCPTGELCDFATGRCAADPCVGVTCAPAEACRAGTCERSCATVMCAAGERCASGRCERDPCASMTCRTGEVCNPADGTCVDDMCTGVRCSSGTTCDILTGTCLPDECNALHCPSGERCEAGECTSTMRPDAGTPRPDAGPPSNIERVLATGGGGCSCDVGAGATSSSSSPFGALALAFGLLGLVAVRRRRVSVSAAARAAVLALTVGVMTVATTGCEVDPFCLNCGDAGGGPVPDSGGGMTDSGGADAGRDAGVSSDAGDAAMPDGCVPGAPEMCNGLDDNCDGVIDEGVDTTRDPHNCGMCGHECTPTGAFPTCVDSVCGFSTCDVGHYDLDGNPDNGCEYACLPTESDDSICDRRDNDCDGMTDEDVPFDTDPLNCGVCGRVCRYAHAAASCVAGDCALGMCAPDFYDVDGNPDNGCEYPCMADPGGVELCNGRDDDCDGMSDEGDPGSGGACGSSVGECMPGVEHCMAGIIVCTGGVSPTTELCNGLDDDCSGASDESNPEGGAPCGSGIGACVQGRNTCVAGAIACVGGTGPVTEVCDGVDNDCDGMIDDGNPGGGGTCGVDTGECAFGTLNCRGGVLACEGGTGATAELCDGLDNDCDGANDQGNPGGGSLCGSDVGLCRPGTNVCSGGSLMCMGASGPSMELCDSLDNDCDGMIDDGNPGGGGTCGIDTGDCSFGTLNCLGGALQCMGGTGPVVEACDGRDNNCNGMVDETFSFMTDVNNCGICGRRCMFAHASPACTAGACALVACDPGWVNLNGLTTDGCEYMCDFAGAEICNGRDDNCDGTVDNMLTPPMSFCNPNGVCAGTMPTCGGMSGWQCNYPPLTYQPVETRCDGLDNDCDGGAPDEPFPGVGTSCNNGALGACRRTGTVVCNMAGTGVVCNAAAPPAGTAEQCDNIDNDCDGTTDEIDNPGVAGVDGITSAAISTVTVSRAAGGTVQMMQYEASRPDATMGAAGSASTVACSRSNVLPWTTVTWNQARTACCALNFGGACPAPAAAGWRLCDAADWQRGCQATGGTCNWSYQATCSSTQPLVCNGDERDSDAVAPGDQDAVAPTGSFAMCNAAWGAAGSVYDMSGNVKEWTNDTSMSGMTTIHPIRGGSYNNVEAGRTCTFNFTVGDNVFAFPNTGFRCCLY